MFCFAVLDALFRGLKAYPEAWMSFMSFIYSMAIFDQKIRIFSPLKVYIIALRHQIYGFGSV
jgi:hypothetical protein